ncbi:hypothetical protein TrispH2_002206 [Trichoplax sp. H2]|nr:hypothetical protein TrispH2_002206 [Trichoplax sp. H2]|eukprot:RDD45805.1 hypothetical protein TrispH2_002206 [Trichoplax sp. H2]
MKFYPGILLGLFCLLAIAIAAEVDQLNDGAFAGLRDEPEIDEYDKEEVNQDEPVNRDDSLAESHDVDDVTGETTKSEEAGRQNGLDVIKDSSEESPDSTNIVVDETTKKEEVDGQEESKGQNDFDELTAFTPTSNTESEVKENEDQNELTDLTADKESDIDEIESNDDHLAKSGRRRRRRRRRRRWVSRRRRRPVVRPVPCQAINLKLTACKSNNAALTAKNRRLKTDKTRLETQVRSQGSTIGRQSAEITNLKNELAALKGKYNNLNASYAHIKRDNARLADQKRLLIKQKNLLRMENDELKRNNATLHTENDRLRSQLISAQANNQRLQNQLNTAENSLRSCNVTKSQLQASVLQLQTDLAHCNSQRCVNCKCKAVPITNREIRSEGNSADVPVADDYGSDEEKVQYVSYE